MVNNLRNKKNFFLKDLLFNIDCLESKNFFLWMFMESEIELYLQVSDMRMAVAVMLPGDLFQQPATPVQNAINTIKNATMNNAIVDLPMSEINKYKMRL